MPRLRQPHLATAHQRRDSVLRPQPTERRTTIALAPARRIPGQAGYQMHDGLIRSGVRTGAAPHLRCEVARAGAAYRHWSQEGQRGAGNRCDDEGRGRKDVAAPHRIHAALLGAASAAIHHPQLTSVKLVVERPTGATAPPRNYASPFRHSRSALTGHDHSSAMSSERAR
jgi:hypothetical protein